MDHTDPGLYSVSFRIRGFGFSKPTEITEDWNVLALDVLRTKRIKGVVAAEKVVEYLDHEYFAQRYIRISELAHSKWQEFELRFFSDGRGVCEYRASAFDGFGVNDDTLQLCGSNVRIVFDSVTVQKLREFRLPWA